MHSLFITGSYSLPILCDACSFFGLKVLLQIRRRQQLHAEAIEHNDNTNVPFYAKKVSPNETTKQLHETERNRCHTANKSWLISSLKPILCFDI